MAIEFRCTKCNKLLRTKDETAGKQAKCPDCGTLLAIPAASTHVPEVPLSGATPLAAAPNPYAEHPLAAATANPYGSPLAMGAEAAAPVGATDIVPTAIDLGDVYSRSWAIVKNNIGMCIAALLLAGVTWFAFSFILQLVFGPLIRMAQNRGLIYPVMAGQQLASQIFGAWIGAGITNFALKMARGNGGEIGDLFSGGRWFVPVLLANLLFLVVVFVGFALLIIPGVIVWLMLSQYQMLIVDRNLGIIEALKKSREITSGNLLTLFAVYLLASLLIIVALLPCGLGLLVYYPWFMILQAVVYLRMTGQATAGPPMTGGYPAPLPNPMPS